MAIGGSYSCGSTPAKPLASDGHAQHGGYFSALRFLKPTLTVEQQADLVIHRGLVADRARLIRRLHSVGYYRLCGYWHHFKQPDDSFWPGTDFEFVWKTYNFDRRLRMVVMEAIERIEVALRCEVYTRIVLRHGPFGHLDRASFPNAKPNQHDDLLRRCRKEAQRSHERFVLHFKNRYDEFPDLPLWAVAQIMSFGSVLTLLSMRCFRSFSGWWPLGAVGETAYSLTLTVFRVCLWLDGDAGRLA